MKNWNIMSISLMLFINYDNYFSPLVVEEHLHPACRGILD